MSNWTSGIIDLIVLVLAGLVAGLFNKVVKLEKNDTRLTNVEAEIDRIDNKIDSIGDKIDSIIENDGLNREKKQRSCDIHTNELSNIRMIINNHDVFFESITKAISDFADIKTQVAVMLSSMQSLQATLVEVSKDTKEALKIGFSHELRIQALEKKPSRATKS